MNRIAFLIACLLMIIAVSGCTTDYSTSGGGYGGQSGHYGHHH